MTYINLLIKHMNVIQKITDLINNPTDIEKIKADFKHNICNSFDELQDIVHHFFDFYRQKKQVK